MKTASIDMSTTITNTNKHIVEEMEPVLNRDQLNLLTIALHGNSVL